MKSVAFFFSPKNHQKSIWASFDRNHITKNFQKYSKFGHTDAFPSPQTSSRMSCFHSLYGQCYKMHFAERKPLGRKCRYPPGITKPGLIVVEQCLQNKAPVTTSVAYREYFSTISVIDLRPKVFLFKYGKIIFGQIPILKEFVHFSLLMGKQDSKFSSAI